MSGFNEQRLAYFYEAMRQGSVRAAAESMGIAPSAVSRQIALLEQELAIPLMQRQGRGVTPTEAGQLLVEYRRSQRAHLDDMLSELAALRGLRRGTVSVAAGEGFIDDLMRGPIEQFRLRYPHISITLDVLGTSEILRRIIEDEAEIGLAYNPPPASQLTSRCINAAPLMVIVSANHPLRMHASVSLRELQRWPLGLLHAGYGIRQLLAHAEFTEKVRLPAPLSTNQIGVLKGFVKSCGGITLLPRFAVQAELASGELQAVPLDSPTMNRAEAHLVTRSGRRLSVAANRFLSYCRTKMRAFQAKGG